MKFIAYLIAITFSVFIIFKKNLAKKNVGIYPQEISHYCYASEIHSSRLAKDAVYKNKTVKLEKELYEISKHSTKRSLTSKTLPIVIHIVHENGTENIPDAQVLQGVEYLNQAFANESVYDPSTGVNTDIQFCLAKRDPDGNATNGINRIVSPLTNLSLENDDINLKNLSRWDPSSYINLWVVKEICSVSAGCGVAGYAYFPTSHGMSEDGAVMEARWVGTSPGNSGVIIHELGHYLGLYHTFQSGCGNADCLLDGDRVCDTPPDQSTAAVPCNATPNSCNTDVNTNDANNNFTTDQNDMFWNYMDYGDWDCYSAFSQGQTERMHSVIEGPRASLLNSNACQDPCTDLIAISFNASTTLVDIGGAVTFTNTTTNASSFNWFVNGVLESTNTNFNYTFPVEGIYEIKLEASNNDPNCLISEMLEVEVRCPVLANYQVNSTTVKPSDVVLFTNISENATSYSWYLDGSLVSTDDNYDNVFNADGTYEVFLIADNGICRDTSFTTIITVSDQGLAQTGLPVWPVLTDRGTSIQGIDWTNVSGPKISNLPTSNPASNFGQTGAAFNDCGKLEFFVVHTGSSDQNQLFIYAPNGESLLTNLTANGPGLNSVRGGNEIQVVRIPGASKEWFVIYNEWSNDIGSPASNAAYNPNRLLYSKVKLEGNGTLNILERDIVLNDNNGNSQMYSDGKAVSRTVKGDLSRHYLYACRRNLGQTSLSVDRFIISNSGIRFDKNTGTVPATWWNLTLAGSPIELSPTEETLAVVHRNQSTNRNDIILFDTDDFDNINYTNISAGDLTLIADGTANDQSNELPYNGRVSNISSDGNLNLNFLRNFERKLSGVEFSPNGRFLYIVSGGYGGSGLSNLTYLGQIDLEATPMELRLQIQTAPYGQYNSNSGTGCQTSNSNCLDNYHPVSHIESCFDGNLYFLKSRQNTIFVIPDPNNFMPQNLIPSNIDLSTTSEPNIITNGPLAYFPDQIDGFLYLNPNAEEVTIVVNKFDCMGNCLAPYDLELIQNDTVVETFEITNCPDTIIFCAEINSRYDLFDPLNEISYVNAIDSLQVTYIDSLEYFDFSMLEECIETCDNQIDDDGDGLIDCDDPDLQDSCCCHIVLLDLDLGPDKIICENGISIFEATDGFEEYIWQDFSTDQNFTAWEPGIYWVDAFDGCEWQSDTIRIVMQETTSVDIGLDREICIGEVININLSGFKTYEWFPKNNIDCTNCESVQIQSDTSLTVIAVATSELGCVSIDTMQIDILPFYLSTIDTSSCYGESIIYDGEELFPGESKTFSYPANFNCDSIINVTVVALDTFYSVIDTSICAGETITIQGNTLQPNQSTPIFLQSKNGCDSTIIFNVSEVDTFYAELDTSICLGETLFIEGEELEINSSNIISLQSSKNCDSIMLINVYPIDTFSIVIDTAICFGEEYYFLGDTLTSNSSTSYGLINSRGCDSTIIVNVRELDTPTRQLDTIICSGDSILFLNEVLYDSGTYTFNKNNLDGCDTILNLTIDYYNDFTVNITENWRVEEGEEIQLLPIITDTINSTYTWTPPIYLSCNNCLSPIASPLEDIAYTLTVTDKNGCIKTREIKIDVEEICDVYIPNVFSPNGDSTNDLFTVFTCEKITTIESLHIYDRWGELIFENYNFPSNELSSGWNGIFHEKPVNPGVFTYMAQVKLLSDELKTYSGDVTLIR